MPKPRFSNKEPSAAEKEELKARGMTRGGKAIVARSKISHPNPDGPGLVHTIMEVDEDGNEFIEDDKGRPVAEWPELPPHVIEKRAQK